jgi:hypothetical protein
MKLLTLNQVGLGHAVQCCATLLLAVLCWDSPHLCDHVGGLLRLLPAAEGGPPPCDTV